MILSLLVAGCYLLLLVGLWLLQDRIVFPGAGHGARVIEAAGVATISLDGPAGPFRVAEFVPEAPAAVLLFFVGNGEDLRSAGRRAAMFGRHGLAVVCPEYPGYGGSAGEPGVAAFHAIAERSVVYAAARARELGVPLVGGGISLGTFCAVRLAAQGQFERLLLAAPPTNMLDAAGARFWWLPLSLMLRHRFDNIESAGAVTCPAFVVHGEADSVVPIELGARLFAALGGEKEIEKEMVRVPGAGHNDLPLEPTTEVGARIGAFLRGR
ncbi:MAG: prolyl oligopeptidase family serine peptidase [Planctomycetes bacterium]|nr:prolyl oligopeptidase family serine peptidase [Planctomycetota bacterium]